ncbi:hypothetical protein DICSQDRAFT_174322 [Dichomitus squalens LYAD-421 SS1]|uniref:F-box domain-containing protein n=1 Tax=Dichomitus squalens (strain LYAD-421) TaxID=732165 RepID=R7SLK8_DICSQ|nr:uncharacterized protein DICSQDRAFT_174322 [Dichomitus squalens LYAD-421 SS1]EJF57046.1 hypothetical protein DICSQDRAFT_174322 [Dichomitus squalens LYAD-421 SS1]
MSYHMEAKLESDAHGPRLPSDILHLILDAIAEWGGSQAKRTLLTCAQTSSFLLRRAQAHLYKDISLSRRRQCALFSRTIDSSPHIAVLVNRVRFSEISASWADYPLPPHVVGRLTSLRRAAFRASVRGLDSGDETAQIKSTSSTTIAFVKLFAVVSPALKHLELDIFIFKSFAELARLLHFLPPFSLSLPVWGAGVRELDLQAFTAQPCSDYYEGLANFTSLEHLRLAFYQEDIRWIAIALRHVRSGRVLSLSFRHRALDQHRAKTLEQLEDLRLDEILRQPIFRNIVQVSWTVVCKEIDDPAAWKKEIAARLPGLVQRKILWYSVHQGELSVSRKSITTHP